MAPFDAGPEELARFQERGYLAVPGLLSPDETRLLAALTERELELEGGLLQRRDARGVVTKLAVRNDLGDDVYSAIVRSRRIVDAMERFLGGEVYHYHHKLMVKEPRTGGAWEWHQDYGYWYGNGCLFPLMASCLVAIGPATRANGCLQVLEGSHLMGRLDHARRGDQTAADPERVAVALERLPVVHCELEPGGALFFHCNLLHRSDRNASDEPRLSLIGCYNAARNDPYREHHHPRYTPLEKWPDERVLAAARAQLAGR